MFEQIFCRRNHLSCRLENMSSELLFDNTLCFEADFFHSELIFEQHEWPQWDLKRKFYHKQCLEKNRLPHPCKRNVNQWQKFREVGRVPILPYQEPDCDRLKNRHNLY